MPASPDFRRYCEEYFARLCRGYANALDDTLIRAWLHGHKMPSDAGGAWDMSTRIFPALCAWLSNPARPRRISPRGQTIDLEALVRAVLERAFDPEQAGFWGREEFKPREQRTVESSMLAYGAWLVRDSILPTISQRGRDCFKQWLEHFGSAEPATTNWALFWIVNHTARKAFGWDHSQEMIDKGWQHIHACHRGDGWMTDGPDGFFDDYNWWVFGMHEMFWMQMDGESQPAQSEEISHRIRQRLGDYPWFFAANGAYAEFGRSLSYKFGRLGCPILAHKLGLWPHGPGMLKRLMRLHLAWYDDKGAIDRVTDTVRQELSEFGHPAVRDSYINTGHPYWCMHAFAALWQLDDDDPIWQADEEPLPVEREDFTRAIVPAGWILTGVKQTGIVHRHALGSRHGTAAYAAKYSKFLYSSHFPFNAGAAEGDFPPDSALCITDGENWAHPGVYDSFHCDDHFLRAAYRLQVGAWEIACETILVPHGESCLRAHRLRVPAEAPSLTIVEGGAPLGYAPGTIPMKVVGQKPILFSSVSDGTLISQIRGVSGYTRALRPGGFRGNQHLNSIHHAALHPILEADSPPVDGPRILMLACIAHAGSAKTPAPNDASVTWDASGDVVIQFAGATHRVGPLGMAAG